MIINFHLFSQIVFYLNFMDSDLKVLKHFSVDIDAKDIEIFLAGLVEEGKRQNEIRKDFSTKNIVESLFIMYMGIQYFWLTFANDNTDLTFEKNFDITWQAIKCQ